MRWEHQRASAQGQTLPMDIDDSAAIGSGRAGLASPGAEPIGPGTPDALAIEITAKSIINRVPGAAQVPFEWTINPYRGCTHSCVYCFARNTHTYLDLDAGHDFDSKIMVKVNAPTLLRRELARASWPGAPIAMGTNTDPYQRIEGRYQLMRGIIAALRDYANPFSILTKGTLILRDLDLLSEAAEVTSVATSTSIGSVDERLWRDVEPGTPGPRPRLEVVRKLAESGIGCSVLMAPILPGLSDSTAQLDETVAAIAEAGACSITPIMLHLRPGAREWYHAWLRREHPRLLPLYARLYGDRSYLPRSYQDEVLGRVAEAKRRHGIISGQGEHRSTAERAEATKSDMDSSETTPAQLSLL